MCSTCNAERGKTRISWWTPCLGWQNYQQTERKISPVLGYGRWGTLKDINFKCLSCACNFVDIGGQLRAGQKVQGVGWAGVVVSKHLTHPIHFIGTKLSDPLLNEASKLHDPPLIKNDIFGCIIRQNQILCIKLRRVLDLFLNNNTKSSKNNIVFVNSKNLHLNPFTLGKRLKWVLGSHRQ